MTTAGNNTCSTGSGCNVPSAEYRKPRYDVAKDDNSYVITVNLPGVKKENISIQLDNETLVIEGVRQNPVDNAWTPRHREIDYTNYRLKLHVNIPVVDGGVTATTNEGVLVVKVPYKEKSKVVDISVS